MREMKHKFIAIPFILFLMGMVSLPNPVFSKGTPDADIKTIKKETQELLTALKKYTYKQRDKAVEKTKSTLGHLDQKIEKLENRIDDQWGEMEASTREKTRKHLKALRKQRVKVAEWYGSLKTSSAQAWEHLKEGISDAYVVLHDTWEKAAGEY